MRSARTSRSAPALSVLRWPHDHHRYCRGLDTATRTAAPDQPNREQNAVTRRGPLLHHAAASALRPSVCGAPIARFTDDNIDAIAREGPDLRHTWEQPTSQTNLRN